MLPLDELAALFRIQEGNSDTAVERVSRADKENLIDSIIDHMVKNHNPVTEERYHSCFGCTILEIIMEIIMDSSSLISSVSSLAK